MQVLVETSTTVDYSYNKSKLSKLWSLSVAIINMVESLILLLTMILHDIEENFSQEQAVPYFELLVL